jgi:hypothetical protein
LTHDFEATCKRLLDAVGCRADVAALKPLVIVPERQKSLSTQRNGLTAQLKNLIHRVGRRYAKARVRVEDSWRARRTAEKQP